MLNNAVKLLPASISIARRSCRSSLSKEPGRSPNKCDVTRIAATKSEQLSPYGSKNQFFVATITEIKMLCRIQIQLILYFLIQRHSDHASCTIISVTFINRIITGKYLNCKPDHMKDTFHVVMGVLGIYREEAPSGRHKQRKNTFTQNIENLGISTLFWPLTLNRHEHTACCCVEKS